MTTRTTATDTRAGDVPVGYDPAQFPAFAVTVDVVILTMAHGELQVLLVRRGQAPFAGMWAIPGGFKLPTETLDASWRRRRGSTPLRCSRSSAPTATRNATRV